MFRGRHRFLLRALFCAALPLALLAPFSAGLTQGSAHSCSCGMKASACVCSLAHGKKPSCGASGAASCAVRSSRPVEEGTARVGLDLRARLGVLEAESPALALQPGGAVVREDLRLPSSFFPPPEAPPPRHLASVS